MCTTMSAADRAISSLPTENLQQNLVLRRPSINAGGIIYVVQVRA